MKYLVGILFSIVILGIVLVSAYFKTFDGSDVTTLNTAEKIEAFAKQHSMFDLMKMASSTMVAKPLTPDEAFEQSDLVVRGHILSITDGRAIVNKKLTYQVPINTALVEVNITDVIKGNATSRVFFEFIRGGLPPELFDAARYEDEVMLFLQKRNLYDDKDQYEVSNSSNRLWNDVNTVYELTDSSTFFIEQERLGRTILDLPLSEADFTSAGQNDPSTGPEVISSFEDLELMLRR